MGVITLIKDLQETISEVHQPSYVNDATRGGQLPWMHYLWDCLTTRVPVRGHLTERTNYILVVGNHNIGRDKK